MRKPPIRPSGTSIRPRAESCQLQAADCKLQASSSSLDRDSLGAELAGRGNEDARLDAARERETRVLLEVHVDLGGGAAALAGMIVSIRWTEQMERRT